jgi:RNA polymerase sigma-70 factor, ECF subfamily
MSTSRLAPDAQSHAHLVGMHRPYLIRFASRRLRDAALIEDMVQETLLAALQGGQGFAGRASLRTWLTGILLRRIADHLRREKRMPATVDVDDSVVMPADDDDGAADVWLGAWNAAHDPQRLLEGRQSLQAVARSLDALPAIAARLLLLREVDGLTHEAASRELGIAPNHASLILHRARSQLRKSVGGEVSHFR